MRKLIMAIGFVLASAAASTAFEVGDRAGPAMMAGGIICDTIDEVKKYIAAVSAGDESMAPKGCGTLTRPVMIAAEIVEIHEADGWRFALARMVIVGMDIEQYGVIGRPVQIGQGV